ncbi:MAG: LabA-like NYN domain-containing protein [Caulobacteraceae bacterium]
MAFYATDRIALFIDGAILYSASKGLNIDLDFKKLLDEFQKRGVLVRAYYYTAIVEDQDYSPIRPLVDWLDYNGFTVVTRAAKEFTDASGRKRHRGDMDVDLAVDMMELAGHIDHAVLFSGDSDFRRLVEAVQRRGVRVTVVSTVKTQPPMASDELRRQADSFVDLADLAAIVARPRAASTMPRLLSAEDNPE